MHEYGRVCPLNLNLVTKMTNGEKNAQDLEKVFEIINYFLAKYLNVLKLVNLNIFTGFPQMLVMLSNFITLLIKRTFENIVFCFFGAPL